MDKKLIRLFALIELTRREFFFYCHLMAPNFYKPNRKYLVDLCNDLQAFYESDDEVLIVNEPPRHGKSRTAGLFVEWVLGNNHNQKIMTGSYNETLSTMFSKNVRNSIMQEKADQYKIVYSDVFPTTKIKHGDGAMNLWSLEHGYNNYLATSPTGTATGFGCSLMIIDDLIKNAMEANNADVLQKHWDWFTNTMLSRLEEGGKIIIIMTRWASGDLAGKALEHYTSSGAKIKHITMKALQDDGTMLCNEVLSRKSYEAKKKAMGADIASANYQQEPIDIKGRLYTSFKTYEKIPVDANGNPLFIAIKNYTDTADTGEDFLCSINYGETLDHEAYAIVKAIFNIPVPIGSRFSLEDLNYIVTEKINDLEYKLKCETVGIEANQHIGKLIPVDYINNLETAEITEILIPGEDAEETEHLRKRYFDSLDSQAFGGNITDYKEQVNAIQGIGGVKVFPVWNGGGTVKLVILNSEFKKPSDDLVNLVQTTIDPAQNQEMGVGIAPIGHTVTVEGVEETTVGIITTITYQTGWTWADIKVYVEDAVDKYLLELNQTWADNDNLTVRISQIETRLLSITGILDIANTSINGVQENLIVPKNNIPIRGVING